jgi:hypothetical protein
MITRYTCSSEQIDNDIELCYDAETPEKAAELHVEENLKTGSQSVVDVRVEFPSREYKNCTELRYVSVTVKSDPPQGNEI